LLASVDLLFINLNSFSILSDAVVVKIKGTKAWTIKDKAAICNWKT
jgi:hypothetical protein